MVLCLQQFYNLSILFINCNSFIIWVYFSSIAFDKNETLHLLDIFQMIGWAPLQLISSWKQRLMPALMKTFPPQTHATNLGRPWRLPSVIGLRSSWQCGIHTEDCCRLCTLEDLQECRPPICPSWHPRLLSPLCPQAFPWWACLFQTWWRPAPSPPPPSSPPPAPCKEPQAVGACLSYPRHTLPLEWWTPVPAPAPPCPTPRSCSRCRSPSTPLLRTASQLTWMACLTQAQRLRPWTASLALPVPFLQMVPWHKRMVPRRVWCRWRVVIAVIRRTPLGLPPPSLKAARRAKLVMGARLLPRWTAAQWRWMMWLCWLICFIYPLSTAPGRFSFFTLCTGWLKTCSLCSLAKKALMRYGMHSVLNEYFRQCSTVKKFL